MTASRFLGIFLSAGVLASLPVAAHANPRDRHFVGGVATPTQIRAERLALRLAADPRILAIRPALRAIVQRIPAASSLSGAEQIDYSIDQWTMSLAIREACSDTDNPQICWHPENSPHSWFGYTFPGMGIAGDDPDRVYRGCFLDSASTYEIRGKFPRNRSAQFNLEAIRAEPGSMAMTNQSAATPDMGNRIAFLENMDVSPDGSFLVTIGPNRGSTRNYMQLSPGPVNLVIRDTFSDWTQQPTQLDIRRIAGPVTQKFSEKQLVDKLTRDLPGWVRFWANFNTAWLGGLKEDQITGPAPREGGWGYLAGGRFNLTDQEALVITTTDANVGATGFQVTNPWMIMPGDVRKATLSLNKGQVTRNPDGSVTYVLSRVDPGFANWIDTGGLAQGIFILRWEAASKGADPKAMIRSFQKMAISELTNLKKVGVPTISKDGRADQIGTRGIEYDLRLGRESRVR